MIFSMQSINNYAILPPVKLLRIALSFGILYASSDLLPTYGKTLKAQSWGFFYFMKVTLTSGKANIYAIQKLKRRIKKHTPKSVYDDCPYCGSYLIVRVSKEKRRFMGCLMYPKCRFTADESSPHALAFSRAEVSSHG